MPVLFMPGRHLAPGVRGADLPRTFKQLQAQPLSRDEIIRQGAASEYGPLGAAV